MQMDEAVSAFLDAWTEDPAGNREGFVQLRRTLAAQPGVQLEWVARPGVTYSLRGTDPSRSRPLRVMIDVIEDAPRWLSVCFYADEVSDPAGQGAFVPGGLLGDDALCFDLETCTPELLAYVRERLVEACRPSGS